MLLSKPKWLIIAFILVTFSALRCFASTSDTLLMKPGVYEPDLRKYYRYYKDETNSSIHNIITELNKGSFQQNKKDNVLNEPISSKPYWVALNIKNDTTLNFPITWNFYEDGILFSVYDVTNASHPQLIASYSNATPTEKRGLGVRCISFKIMLPPGQTVRLLAKCNITTSNQMYIPTDVTTTEDILKYEMEYSLLVGRYFGFFLFALLFNLLVYFFSKQSLYLYQFFYILSISLFNIIELLYDAMLLPEWLHQFLVIIPKNSFLALSLYFAIHVFEQFTALKTTFSKTYNWIQWLKYFVLALICLFITPVLFNYDMHPLVLQTRNIATIVTLFTYAIFVCFIVAGCIKKNALHLLYLLSVSPILLGFISFVLNGYFVFKIYHIEPGNLMVGLAIELLLQTLFFSYRYKFLNLSINKLAIEKKEIEKNVTHDVMQAQEMERVKISEDLHDHLGNDFLGLQMLTDRLLQMNQDQGSPIDVTLLSQIKGEISNMATDMRYITHALSQKYIVEEGLINLINKRIELLNNGGNIKFSFEHSGNPELLSTMSNITIFRIILEALNNIIKHSSATEATIKLLLDDHTITIIAKDNGIGFN